MVAIVMKSIAAFAATAGLALTSVPGQFTDGYADEDKLAALTLKDVGENAKAVFARSDRDQNGYIDVDEYSALRVVTAELARLNGFVWIDGDDNSGRIAISYDGSASLAPYERVRITAVARSAFYEAAGEDGRISETEYVEASLTAFDMADRNRNGVLRRAELSAFASRKAGYTLSV